MAEAGPSSPNGTASSTFSASPPSTSKQSAIRFPQEDSRPSLRDSRAPTAAPIGLGKPPILRTPISRPTQASPQLRTEDGRRRVKSVDPSTLAHRTERSNDMNGVQSKGHARPNRKHSRKDKSTYGGGAREDANETSILSAFSDEYDLSHEDPRILEDVQRAMKLKARREARLRAISMTAPQNDASIQSGASGSSQSSPVRAHHSIPPPSHTYSADLSIESDVDFSPSIGTGIAPLHPVPSSSNGGATLDWTFSASEDEKADRRWSLSIPKRIAREKSTAPPGRQVVEKQDSLYVDKLSRIKAKASSPTLRKAQITADQLQRRYNLVYNSLGRPKSVASYNPAAVVHWYSKQDQAMKTALDTTEPLTWLKHLLDGRGEKAARSPWYITALVAEEYIQHHTNPHPMGSIPEDTVAPDASPASATFADAKSPSSSTWSWTPPPLSLEPSISRKRASYDAQLSFEPHVESGRDSVGAESRASSEGIARKWRMSLANGASSPRSSIHSDRHGASPTSSRLHLLEIPKRIRRRANDSDENLSSARNSLSERSPSEDGHPKTKSVRVENRPPTAQLQPTADSGKDSDTGDYLNGNGDAATSDEEGLNQDPDLSMGMNLRTPRPQGFPDLADAQFSSRRASVTRKARISLPISPDLAALEQDREQREANEEKEREEYERKAQILEDMLSQNYRIRQLLQRVGGSIAEYDMVQSSLTTVLGVPYEKIPPEVLDAFTHDPSAVTSNTTTVNGWRAVDFIHERIARQRQILQEFVSSTSPEQSSLCLSGNVFVDPIASLMQTMTELELRQAQMMQQVQGVVETLGRVKAVHGEVKKEYNDTLTHTSLVYPELSQIVTLEENWRNHYQQFWDFALDALTLLLDTVTPFWRIYGKVIGEDVQDFLIIPWYRNEFTGEPKRYLIEKFPRRSLRHCLGLALLSFLSVVLVWLQFRAAVTSTINYRLPWIANGGLRVLCLPFFSIAIVVQWCAVLTECCIVLAQGGVIIWWMGWAVNLFD